MSFALTVNQKRAYLVFTIFVGLFPSLQNINALWDYPPIITLIFVGLFLPVAFRLFNNNLEKRDTWETIVYANCLALAMQAIACVAYAFEEPRLELAALFLLFNALVNGCVIILGIYAISRLRKIPSEEALYPLIPPLYVNRILSVSAVLITTIALVWWFPFMFF